MRTFPTTFVWDHGGADIHLFISKPNGNETIKLDKSGDGTYEITTELGQGRYEYCFSVDGKWTHDPDLPAIKNANGHYSNMLKIVDPKINFSNKAANLENLEKGIEDGGIHNFVEKCFSDATINEIMERENVLSLSNTLTTSNEHFSDDSDTDEFPDLDDALEEALDFDNPKFITESPHPARKFITIPNPASNISLNLSSDKINEIDFTKRKSDALNRSMSENNQNTTQDIQKQGVVMQTEPRVESKDKQEPEVKSSETKQEIPLNILNSGKENGISHENKAGNTPKLSIEITSTDELQVNTNGINSENLTDNTLATYVSDETFKVTMTDDSNERNTATQKEDTGTKCDSNDSADRTKALAISDCLTEEKLTTTSSKQAEDSSKYKISEEAVLENGIDADIEEQVCMDFNSQQQKREDILLNITPFSEGIKNIKTDKDAKSVVSNEEQEIMQSYDDEVSNYYEKQQTTNLPAQNIEAKISGLKVEKCAEQNMPVETLTLIETSQKSPNKNIEIIEASFSQEVNITEEDVNGNIIDNDITKEEYPSNVIQITSNELRTKAYFTPEEIEIESQSIQIKPKEITKVKTDFDESKAEATERKEKITEVMLDSNEVLYESKHLKEDLTGHKQTSSLPEITGSISEVSDSKEKLKELRPEIQENKQDIKEHKKETTENKPEGTENKLDVESRIVISEEKSKVKDYQTEEKVSILETKQSTSLQIEQNNKQTFKSSLYTESGQEQGLLTIEEQVFMDFNSQQQKREDILLNITPFSEAVVNIKSDEDENSVVSNEKLQINSMNAESDKFAHDNDKSSENDAIDTLTENNNLVLETQNSYSSSNEDVPDGLNHAVGDDSKCIEQCENKLNRNEDDMPEENVNGCSSKENIPDGDVDNLSTNDKDEKRDKHISVDLKNNVNTYLAIHTSKQEVIPEIFISLQSKNESDDEKINKYEGQLPDRAEKVGDVMSDRSQITDDSHREKDEQLSLSKEEQLDNKQEFKVVEQAISPLPNELPIIVIGEEIHLVEIEVSKHSGVKEDKRSINSEEKDTFTKTIEEPNTVEEILIDENFKNSANEVASQIDEKNDLIDLSDHQNDSGQTLSEDEINVGLNDVENATHVSETSNMNNSSENISTGAVSKNYNNEVSNQDGKPTQDSISVHNSTNEFSNLEEVKGADSLNIINDFVNELVNKNDDRQEEKINDSEVLINIEKAEEEMEMNQCDHVERAPEKASKDLFSQINNTLVSIQKSKSNADLKLNQEIPNQEIPKSESKKDILGSVKETGSPKVEKKELNKNLITKNVHENKQPVVEVKEPNDSLPVQSPMEQRREAERIKMERMRMSKKLDEVFGVIRSESVDDMKTEIRVRGMGEVNLKRQVVRKTTVEHNKMDEYEQKRVARQQISMPEKPATFKKPKPKVEVKPEPVVEPPKPVEEEKPKPPKKSCFVFIQKPKEPSPEPPKEPTPTPITKQRTPDLQSKFWPTPELPTPQQPEYIENDDDLIQLSPEKPLPLKIGINGFDRVGRLAFRAAFDAGLEISAVNDPFIPLHYMVYSLKFDMAHNHSKSRRKEITVTESPLGQLIVNGKVVTVFTELDPRKIPWNEAGVNYVIEATESLNSKINARHHLEPDQDVAAMKDIINREEKVLSGDFLKVEQDASDSTKQSQSENKESTKPVCNVKKVIIAGNSTDFPSFGIGINDERITKSMGVIGNISAQANALILPLKIILDNFGMRYCSYTLLKAIIGPSKDIKCPTMGPATHKKSIKWDFSENLVPAPCPVLEEETLRFLPAMRGKLHGIVVYTPVPEVSMFDLTICIEGEAEHIYKDICLEMKRQAEGKLKNVMKYVSKVGDETSASCVFTGCPQSVVFDERSGCQIDRSTVKIVLWFDNEYGFANRIVDLVKKAYETNIPK